jgi:hypothetical protein
MSAFATTDLTVVSKGRGPGKMQASIPVGGEIV